jgi:hypothetical protein
MRDTPLASPAKGEGTYITPPLMGGDEGEGFFLTGKERSLERL